MSAQPPQALDTNEQTHIRTHICISICWNSCSKMSMHSPQSLQALHKPLKPAHIHIIYRVVAATLDVLAHTLSPTFAGACIICRCAATLSHCIRNHSAMLSLSRHTRTHTATHTPACFRFTHLSFLCQVQLWHQHATLQPLPFWSNFPYEL